MCSSEEKTRQWRGSEGESRRSEATLEFLGNIGEAKKNKGRRGEGRGAFGCRRRSGKSEFGSAGDVMEVDCEREEEGTEDISGSNGLPSRAHFLLISPDSRLDRRADICRLMWIYLCPHRGSAGGRSLRKVQPLSLGLVFFFFFWVTGRKFFLCLEFGAIR